MNEQKKKQLMMEYKQRPLQGGICIIRNMKNQRYLLIADKNIKRFENQFAFMQSTGTCTMNKLMKDWNTYGKDAFTFEMLEEITMKEDEALEDFQDNLNILKLVWQDKLEANKSY